MLSNENSNNCELMLISRFKVGSLQTQGHCLILNKLGRCVFACASLELAELGNQISQSRIPAGTYDCRKIVHKKYGKCFYIKGVSKRTGILIHVGNYQFQSRGCILLGEDFEDINDDMLVDVIHSRSAIDKVYSLLSENFQLIIK